MSKRRLNNFIAELDKAELREQIIDLYDRFKNVKEFYDFSFHPNEDKRLNEAKLKITKEYFPDNNRKPKKRRSVAQKLIVNLQQLEIEPVKIADLMLYNIEVAQTFTEEFYLNQESFFKSMHNSFKVALIYIDKNFILEDFRTRIDLIITRANSQDWFNKKAFELSKASILEK